MRVLSTAVCLAALTTSALAAPAIVREVQMRAVPPQAALPADLTSPEGKTRWHLESLSLGDATTVAVSKNAQELVTETRGTGPAAVSLRISGADAERWLLPDRDPSQMKMGASVALRFEEMRDGLVDKMVAEVSTVGIGWLHLPSAPHEVVLQRALVLRQRAGERAMHPDLLIHRWVSPREGVLAEISGPATSDGGRRFSVGSITVVDSVNSAATMKLYADQLYRGTYTDINYGWDRGPGAPVSSMVPNAGVNNACDLVNLSTWNFSAINSGKQTATTEAPINLVQTCNANSCGYANSPSGGGLETPILERYDRDFTGTLRRDNQVIQKDVQPTGVTYWLRAGAQNETVSGSFGSGETRFCFTDEAGKPRNEVPVWQMPHSDAGGWYTQANDTWTSVPLNRKFCHTTTSTVCTTNADCPAGEACDVFECEQSFYNCVCGSCGGFLQTLYSRGCSASSPTQNYAGALFNKVIKGGVVILPSGHTLNALVVRNTTEFCTYTGSGCTGILTPVRTIVYIFEAPYVGAVALLRGPQTTLYTSTELGAGAETPCTNFTSFEYTNISYGNLPPVSITAGATTNTSVSVSWNPGNDTHHVVGYKVYWDTDSGASTPYAFNSVTNAGQVVIAGTTATISGLTAGTTYYVTVTTLSDWTDRTTSPPTPVTTRYESIKYPTTVSGDPSFSYPIEVAATTTGGAVKPVPDGVFGTAMRASRADAPGSTIALTWDIATCSSADHHVLYGDLSSVSSLSVTGGACNLGTTGSANWAGVPASNLWFVVVGDNDATIEGSWGTDGVGGQRGGTTPSGQCGLVTRNNSGTCP
jgi:hypothetical protein